MRESAIRVDSRVACKNREPVPDGAYTCFLQYVSGAGVQRKSVDMGNKNPSSFGLRRLIPKLSVSINSEHKYSADQNIALERFLGLTIVRYCVRDGHGAEPVPGKPDVPRVEAVRRIVFTANPGVLVPIAPVEVADKRKLEAKGVGPGKRLDIPRHPRIENVVQLATAPEDPKYLSSSAVLAPSARGRLSDIVVMVHQIVPENPDSLEQPKYLEEIVDIRNYAP